MCRLVEMAVWEFMCLFVLAFAVTTVFSSNAVTREYCLQERWNMTCGDDHVIMISEATYGRMQGGHKSCITTYNTGCSADVTTHLDGMCSGRQTCENDVRWLMDFANPCSRDLTSYLKVTYKCVRVITSNVAHCIGGNVPIPDIQQAPEGFLASKVAREDIHGSEDCPWHLKVAPGQTINLTLFDFRQRVTTNDVGSAATMPGVEYPDAACDYGLTVREGDNSVSLCDNRQTKLGAQRTKRATFQSKSNELFVHFLTPMNTEEERLIVHYKVLGCADPEIPVEAFLNRHENTAEVTCNISRETWYLYCKDNMWVGEAGNCTAYSTTPELNQKPKEVNALSLMLAVIIGIVLGLLGGLILLGSVVYFRRRCRAPKPDDPLKGRQSPYYQPCGTMAHEIACLETLDSTATMLEGCASPMFKSTKAPTATALTETDYATRTTIAASPQTNATYVAVRTTQPRSGSVSAAVNSPGCTENIIVKVPNCQVDYNTVDNQHNHQGCGTGSRSDGMFQCVAMRSAAGAPHVYGTHPLYEAPATHSAHGDYPPIYGTHTHSNHQDVQPPVAPDCCGMDESHRGVEQIMMYGQAQQHAQQQPV